MNDKYINFTVIIPHYNIPHLLQRCLDSIPTREDLQIIVVDDNSSSEIVDFENFPGNNRNDVILLFDKKGGGAGYARNLGLSVAKGKWILFADADDYFVENVNDLFEKYKDYSCDVVFFNSYSVDVSKNKIGFGDQINKAMSTYSDLCLERYLRYYCGVPWGKLIKHNLIINNDIKFDEVQKHNDTMFSLKVGYYASQVCVEQNMYYVNYCRMGSISNNTNYEKGLYSTIRVAVSYNLFIKEKNISYANKWALYYRLKECFLKNPLYLFKALYYIGLKDMLRVRLFYNSFLFVLFLLKNKILKYK